MLEVTEYVEHEHVRMIADSHGTVWDSILAAGLPLGEGKATAPGFPGFHPGLLIGTPPPGA